MINSGILLCSLELLLTCIWGFLIVLLMLVLIGIKGRVLKSHITMFEFCERIENGKSFEMAKHWNVILIFFQDG